MAYVLEGRPASLNRWLGSFERWIYRLCRINPGEEMEWKTYAFAMLAFNVLGIVVVYALQGLQHLLLLNLAHLSAVSTDSAFNTAVSFATNTNWQGYAGETTMSYLRQMLGPSLATGGRRRSETMWTVAAKGSETLGVGNALSTTSCSRSIVREPMSVKV